MAELTEQLQTSNDETSNTIKQTELSIKITIKTIEKLKTHFNNYTFENKAEEIEFFKITKPNIAAKLIYYNEIYNMELAKPNGSKKGIKKHYVSYYQKFKMFHKENAEFIKYYRSGNTYLDKKYFLRRKHDIRLTLDSAYFQSDYNFATSHDYKVAQIIAYENVLKYIEGTILALKKKSIVNHLKSKTNIKWTGSKVALVELMYALHSEAVLNYGNINLKELAHNFETIFNIELGQFNRIYLEIRNRKSIEKTHFLNTLRNKLLNRIEEAEG
jgi:hypothetical protein